MGILCDELHKGFPKFLIFTAAHHCKHPIHGGCVNKSKEIGVQNFHFHSERKLDKRGKRPTQTKAFLYGT